MDLLLDDLAMDDSFLAPAMDDEVSQILMKWNNKNSNLKKSSEKDLDHEVSTACKNETFDTRTFTRPKKLDNEPTFNFSTFPASEASKLEVLPYNLPMSSFLRPVTSNNMSPPNSIRRSNDFQNNDNVMSSLITSGDFSNVSFLLNENDCTVDPLCSVSPTKNIANNLMDFTFDVSKQPFSTTFTTAAKNGLHNTINLENDEHQTSPKNLTYDAHQNGNLTWTDIQNNFDNLNKTIVQSTPVHTSGSNGVSFDHTISPISSARVVLDDDEEVIIRNLKARNLANELLNEGDRNSLEDQCEFLLNEETIKLSSRVYGSTFECLDFKTALIQSTDADEKEFDVMLKTFDVEKSVGSESFLQSVDNIKQRHSIINFEKQRVNKQKQIEENCDNKTQFDAINKSSERLLRRSRQYDDINLQLQKQQIDAESSNSAKSEEAPHSNDRDRFKTIKLNKKLQSGMVVVNDEPDQKQSVDSTSSSPGAIKERTNQINQFKHDNNEAKFKKPAPSKLSNFGFSRPSYRSRNDLNLPLKANSTDSLDNDEPHVSKLGANAKSPMGIKSKSIHNLMYNMKSDLRAGSYNNLKPATETTGSQSNLRAPRTSSLVRYGQEGQRVQAPSLTQMRAPISRKTSLVRPSSAYYGKNFSLKQCDSDKEPGYSLSSSSVALQKKDQVSSGIDRKNNTNDSSSIKRANTGAIPKPSNLRAPQAKSGLIPRPSPVVRR